MMTDDELEARWQRRLAARKQNATEADELACAICEIEGGDAMIEATHARNEVFNWVWRLPEYNRVARERILHETE
jgi:hypothetical protein